MKGRLHDRDRPRPGREQLDRRLRLGQRQLGREPQPESRAPLRRWQRDRVLRPRHREHRFARVSDWFTVPAGETLDSVTVAWRTAATLATTFWVDGVQIEPHTFATPYLAATAMSIIAALTRLFAPATTITNTQGWVALRFRAGLSTGDLSASEQPYAFRWADDSNRISLSLNSGGQWVLARANGSNTDNVSVGKLQPGAIVQALAAWTTGLNLSLNGAAFTTVTASSGSDTLWLRKPLMAPTDKAQHPAATSAGSRPASARSAA